MASWDRKLDRAEEHMEALARAIEGFIATDPYTIGRKLESDGVEHIYFFTKYTEPPDEIGLLVGDAVHNLRASLDHIVLALAEKGADAAGVTMTRKAGRSIQFPVADTADDFEYQIGRHRLRYVEPMAKTIIEHLQPYRLRPGDIEKCWIYIVNDLDITDKHRTIPATAAVVSYHVLRKLPEGIEQPRVMFKKGTDWGPEAEIVRYRFSKPEPDVDMEFSATFTVALEGGWPPNGRADTVLASYAEDIREWVINPLQPYL